MRTYPALMSVIVLLFSSGLHATQAPDAKFVVKYDGGTFPLAHQTLDFYVVNDEVVLNQGEKRFVVPIAQITQVVYGHVSNTTQEHAGIVWAGGKPPANGQIVLVVERADYGRFVAILQGLLERATLAKSDQTGK